MEINLNLTENEVDALKYFFKRFKQETTFKFSNDLHTPHSFHYHDLTIDSDILNSILDKLDQKTDWRSICPTTEKGEE